MGTTDLGSTWGEIFKGPPDLALLGLLLDFLADFHGGWDRYGVCGRKRGEWNKYRTIRSPFLGHVPSGPKIFPLPPLPTRFIGFRTCLL